MSNIDSEARNAHLRLAEEARELARQNKPLDAISIARPLAERGDLDCRNLLGWIYSRGGPNVEKDLNIAIAWLEPAAKLGHPASTYLLAIARFELGEYADAERWFLHAGKSGYSAAWYQLAKMYQKGSGVAKDQRYAKQLYRAAAELGHVYAIKYLATAEYESAIGFVSKFKAGMRLLWTMMRLIKSVYADPYSERNFD